VDGDPRAKPILPDAAETESRGARPMRFKIYLVALGFGCAAVMAWIGAADDRLAEAYGFTGKRGDYYSLLVSGFLRGIYIWT